MARKRKTIEEQIDTVVQNAEGPSVPDWAIAEMIKEHEAQTTEEAPVPPVEEGYPETEEYFKDVLEEQEWTDSWVQEGLRLEDQAVLDTQMDQQRVYIESMKARAAELGVSLPDTYEKAKEFEASIPRTEKWAELQELSSQYSKAQLEANILAQRNFIREHSPSKWKTFRKGAKSLGGFVEKKLKPRPRGDLTRFYIPHTMKEYYVPGAKVRKLTTPPGQESIIADVNRPRLEKLRTSSAPPPSQRIKAPFRNVQAEEGLGPALGRLRKISKFPSVDWAVYQEIHANGDVDTPSHVKQEVAQLGFSKKEINDSLSRLRKLGVIKASGMSHNGEKELEIVGDEHGHK